MIKGFAIGLLLYLLGLGLRASAQELPPPGGWPLRPVTELQVVPEPPGGLVPYRKGRLWGYADTTGRVWIQPQFEQEPPLFGGGLLLRTVTAGPRAETYWTQRYGVVQWQAGSGPPVLQWRVGLSREEEVRRGRSYLLNARGEQLTADWQQAVVPGPDGRWRAVRRSRQLRQAELLAVQPRAVEAGGAGGRLITRPAGPRLPQAPRRLRRPRRYELNQAFVGALPYRYLARKVDWLRPHRLAWFRGRCGSRHQEEVTRYRHEGLQAVFDERGRRLTGYRYLDASALTPRLLRYEGQGSTGRWEEEQAAERAGLPQPWALQAPNYHHHYGLLTAAGRELTPPDFLSLRPIGPNAYWVVALRDSTLQYGVLDSLGRYRIPLAPEPLSSTDAAGLLRRRSSVPLGWPEHHSFSPYDLARYPDTATISFVRPDGRLAFAGRFEEASGFWQNRALVRQHGRYGVIDTLGRWVVPPQDAELSFYRPTEPHWRSMEAADPLNLFYAFRPGSRYTTAPDDSVLLLVRRQQAYGLMGSRSGRVFIQPCFDKKPEPWRGAMYGLRQGQPWLVTATGQSLRPEEAGRNRPAGVGPYDWSLIDTWLSLPLQRTPQGYRTRGGRQLWED